MTDPESPIELTPVQFERLVSLVAETRIDMRTMLNEFREENRIRHDEAKRNLALIQSSLGVVEEDLGAVQRTLREHGALLVRHGEAFDGLTKLASTNFDLIESINKHIHGESGSISHGEESQGAGHQ
jgi:hypothetical protein